MNTNTIITKRFCLTAIALITLTFLSACTTCPKSVASQKGKLHHIGLVWLKEPGNAADRQKVIDAAHLFAREIPEVLCLSVGQTLPGNNPLIDATFDVCLVMQFDDQAGMDRYAKNPVHQKAATEVFLPLSNKLLFYDFISE